ncbi:cupin domain-containing protein [Sneathiella sp.]|jgi:50S ribosomal protein L16 3-hydroxylase|uniref:cupin domain-containing protein n=1 Tax=Sneathiella sp. TaxID=1964365 RepID=UPI0039E673FD
MSLILDHLPTSKEFFLEFWNRKPFVVRGLIPTEVTETLIDEDHVAGLAMEEEVKSRLVRKGKKQSDWKCDYGPLPEQVFAELGEEDWSLLVQNVDLYHEETAELLKHFNFCPRWLLDDIMVSYSPKGGTVGSHSDSYHVFLVQGKGERRWKIAHEALKNGDHIEDIPLKILKTSFDGEEVTVSEGDVIYIPPQFPHEGVSLQPSLTYSVGFLGPTLSEMLIEFGHFLEENYQNMPRYLGQNLTENAVPFQVGADHIRDFRSFMTDVFDEDYFVKWLAQYFSKPAQNFGDEFGEEFDSDSADEDPLGAVYDYVQDTAKTLIDGDCQLIKRPFVKIMITPLKSPQQYAVSVGDLSFELAFSDLFVVNMMAQETPFSAKIFAKHADILQKLLDGNCLEIIDA